MKKTKIQTFLRELTSDFYWSQLLVVACLMVLSTLFIYSATYRGGDDLPERVKSQWIWFAMGLICYFIVSLVDYHWICRKSWLFYGSVLALLIWVLKYGRVIFGARRWITLPGFSIQPSEFAKISVMLALCYYLSKHINRLSEWRHLGIASALAIVPGWLIHKQPDLGTALVVGALFLMLLFLAGAPMRFFGWFGTMMVIIISFVGYDTYRYIQFRDGIVAGRISPSVKFRSYVHFDRYKFDRILVWVLPEKSDRLGEGWNARQSLTAIGSGGLNGKGWAKGDVTRGGYLPRTVSLNDFIFAVFAEETGFVGGIVLIGLYAILLMGGIKIAMRARDPLGMLLAAGITFLLFFHVFVNMGMTLGILPIVGVPLPIMSYGGSFVLVCMIALGLLQSVWLHRKPY